ncbi:MAG: acyl-CoA dehydratase activase, partial [Firmicutes bacterium]|nr:acyl-CoA dehydratase activase [Bacillota bacterium]
MNGCFLGVDVGSVSTNAVLLDEKERLLEKVYLRTKGDPIGALREALRCLAPRLAGAAVLGVGATGSGRRLAGLILGADVVKNEITAHAVAAQWAVPEVRTVIEIGGQDSKLIILRDGVVVDFAMNTVCAAGTGSFLDQQAARLGIPVEELGELARGSTAPVQIAGRCAVFAESDMIHKQQVGHTLPDILAGLCQALVRNYLNNLAKGKELLPPVVFQGGVAANALVLVRQGLDQSGHGVACLAANTPQGKRRPGSHRRVGVLQSLGQGGDGGLGLRSDGAQGHGRRRAAGAPRRGRSGDDRLPGLAPLPGERREAPGEPGRLPCSGRAVGGGGADRLPGRDQPGHGHHQHPPRPGRSVPHLRAVFLRVAAVLAHERAWPCT